MSPGRGSPSPYTSLLTISRSRSSSVGAMLRPSTRATWNPNVTMMVAYTAADSRVCAPATSSLATRRHVLPGSDGWTTTDGSATDGVSETSGKSAASGDSPMNSMSGGGWATAPSNSAEDPGSCRSKRTDGSIETGWSTGSISFIKTVGSEYH